MKRTMLVAVMVLGTSFCSQSFGFDLLDRMLGLKGSGCDSTCCDTVAYEAAGCGACAEPACGCEAPCGDALYGAAAAGPCGCAEPVCGCEATYTACEVAPACGCDSSHFGGKKHHLLDKLFGGLKCCDKGCDSACEPACGCEVAPVCEVDPCGCAAETSCCGGKKGGLLKKLFGRLHGHNGHGCDSACDAAMGCGCGSAPVAAPVMDAAPIQQVNPMPPAPTPDHSAFLNSKRRVIQASNYAR